MDEGHLTDSHGRRVDFKNAIVVMTSNIGSGLFLLVVMLLLLLLYRY